MLRLVAMVARLVVVGLVMMLVMAVVMAPPTMESGALSVMFPTNTVTAGPVGIDWRGLVNNDHCHY